MSTMILMITVKMRMKAKMTNQMTTNKKELLMLHMELLLVDQHFHVAISSNILAHLVYYSQLVYRLLGPVLKMLPSSRVS